MYKPGLVDEYFNEHVRLLGAPQIVVTRGWAWNFYKELGYSFKPGSFCSIDYMAMHPEAVSEPLTDLNDPLATALLMAMRRDAGVTAND